MTIYCIILIKILIIGFLQASSCQGDEIALVIKVIGKVQYLSETEEGKFRSLKVGSPICSELEIRTRKKSFVKIAYLDDGTILNIFEKSSLIIKGNSIKKTINDKGIYVNTGILNIDIVSQGDNTFILKGMQTEFSCNYCSVWFTSDKKYGDIIYKISGFGNLVDSKSLIPFILTDSTIIDLENKNEKEYDRLIDTCMQLELLAYDFDEKQPNPEICKDEFRNLEKNRSLDQSDQMNLAIIKLKNPVNVEREIIIKYKEVLKDSMLINQK